MSQVQELEVLLGEEKKIVKMGLQSVHQENVKNYLNLDQAGQCVAYPQSLRVTRDVPVVQVLVPEKRRKTRISENPEFRYISTFRIEFANKHILVIKHEIH